MFSVFRNADFLGAFLYVFVCIGGGYLLRRKGILDDGAKRVVTSLIWKLTLPCLAFVAFIRDFSAEDLKNGGSVLLFSLIAYLVFLFGGKFAFSKWGKDAATVTAVMSTIGQLTLFTMPLVRALGSSDAMFYCGIMTLTFRFVLYFLAYPMITQKSDEKISFGESLAKVFKNPVMIAMILGVALWLLQAVVPTVNGVQILRPDQSIPAVYKVMSNLSDLVCPLGMIMIGLIVGESDLGDVFRNGRAWIGALVRTVLCPLAVFLFSRFVFGSVFDASAVAALTLGFAAPGTITACAFCSAAEKEEKLASHIAVLSTVLCLVTIPVFSALTLFA